MRASVFNQHWCHHSLPERLAVAPIVLALVILLAYLARSLRQRLARLETTEEFPHQRMPTLFRHLSNFHTSDYIIYQLLSQCTTSLVLSSHFCFSHSQGFFLAFWRLIFWRLHTLLSARFYFTSNHKNLKPLTSTWGFEHPFQNVAREKRWQIRREIQQ